MEENALKFLTSNTDGFFVGAGASMQNVHDARGLLRMLGACVGCGADIYRNYQTFSDDDDGRRRERADP